MKPKLELVGLYLMILESIERKSPTLKISSDGIALGTGTLTWTNSPYITTTTASPTVINPTYVTSATTDSAVYINGERLDGVHAAQFTTLSSGTLSSSNITLSSDTAYVNNQSLGVMVSGPRK